MKQPIALGRWASWFITAIAIAGYAFIALAAAAALTAGGAAK